MKAKIILFLALFLAVLAMLLPVCYMYINYNTPKEIKSETKQVKDARDSVYQIYDMYRGLIMKDLNEYVINIDKRNDSYYNYQGYVSEEEFQAAMQKWRDPGVKNHVYAVKNVIDNMCDILDKHPDIFSEFYPYMYDMLDKQIKLTQQYVSPDNIPELMKVIRSEIERVQCSLNKWKNTKNLYKV